MDMSLSKLQGLVKDKEDWPAAVHGSQRVRHNWVTEQQQYLREYILDTSMLDGVLGDSILTETRPQGTPGVFQLCVVGI